MRKFIEVNAADYIGMDEPEANVINIAVAGPEGTLEAIQRSELGWFWDKDEFPELIAEKGGMKETVTHLQDQYKELNGDGCPMRFLFELVDDKMKLILG
jgi:hypothetical protein